MKLVTPPRKVPRSTAPQPGHIYPGSVAHQSGKINKGDVLRAVERIPLRGRTSADVISIFEDNKHKSSILLSFEHIQGRLEVVLKPGDTVSPKPSLTKIKPRPAAAPRNSASPHSPSRKTVESVSSPKAPGSAGTLSFAGCGSSEGSSRSRVDRSPSSVQSPSNINLTSTERKAWRELTALQGPGGGNGEPTHPTSPVSHFPNSPLLIKAAVNPWAILRSMDSRDSTETVGQGGGMKALIEALCPPTSKVMGSGPLGREEISAGGDSSCAMLSGDIIPEVGMDPENAKDAARDSRFAPGPSLPGGMGEKFGAAQATAVLPGPAEEWVSPSEVARGVDRNQQSQGKVQHNNPWKAMREQPLYDSTVDLDRAQLGTFPLSQFFIPNDNNAAQDNNATFSDRSLSLIEPEEPGSELEDALGLNEDRVDSEPVDFSFSQEVMQADGSIFV